MKCVKCLRDIPDICTYCMFCGWKQSRGVRSRNPNGAGTAYKRNNTWTVKVYIGTKVNAKGKRVPQVRTKGGFKTKSAALKYAPVLLGTQPTKFNTFLEIYWRWKDSYESRVSTSTMKGYDAAIAHFKSLYDMPINRVTANLLQNCISMTTQGRRTKQMMKVVAGLVMKYAMDDNQIAKNPAENLYTGNEESVPREPITDQELKVIKEAFGTEPYAKYVYALCYLGFRPTEFLSLTKDSYHEEGEYHYFVAGIKTKAGKNRVVTIPPAILPIIKERLEVDGTEYLFPRMSTNRKGEPTGFVQITEAYFREFIFKPMMDRLGISGKVPYSTRHTYADKIKHADGPARDKAALMGHSDYSTTQRFYQSTNIEERSAITDQL